MDLSIKTRLLEDNTQATSQLQLALEAVQGENKQLQTSLSQHDAVAQG